MTATRQTSRRCDHTRARHDPVLIVMAKISAEPLDTPGRVGAPRRCAPPARRPARGASSSAHLDQWPAQIRAYSLSPFRFAQVRFVFLAMWPTFSLAEADGLTGPLLRRRRASHRQSAGLCPNSKARNSDEYNRVLFPTARAFFARKLLVVKQAVNQSTSPHAE